MQLRTTTMDRVPWIVWTDLKLARIYKKCYTRDIFGSDVYKRKSKLKYLEGQLMKSL